MRIVVEVGADEQYLRDMQAESDQAWQEDPDYGEGSLSLGITHMSAEARIIGIYHEAGGPGPYVEELSA